MSLADPILYQLSADETELQIRDLASFADWLAEQRLSRSDELQIQELAWQIIKTLDPEGMTQ